jgi:uncharacterized membrane protein
MIWRWRYYIGAALVVGYLLLSHGAPPIAVIAGLAGVAMFMRRWSSKLT